MRYLYILILALSTTGIVPLMAQEELSKLAIGKWRDHQNYTFTKNVEDAGDIVYVSCDFSLFSYDKTDGSIERYSKVSGLSDVEISTISYSKSLKTLLIAYANGNIDLLISGRVYNISGIKNKMLQGDKTIYNITFEGNYAYLSCGFGIVVVDIKRKEIKDTYIIGEESSNLKINNVAFNDTSIFAATEKGILYADRNNSFLAYFRNWKTLENTPYPSTEYKDVLVFNNYLIISTLTGGTTEDPWYTFYYWNKDLNEWTIFLGEPGAVQPINYSNIKVCNNNLIINCHYVIVFINSNLEPINYYYVGTNEVSYDLYDAMVDSKNKLWVATKAWGLFEYKDYTKDKSFIAHMPTGPTRPTVYRIRNYDDVIYMAPGGRGQQYDARYFEANLYTLRDNWWTQLDLSQLPAVTDNRRIADVIDASVYYKNPNKIFATTWSVGILEIENNRIKKIYDETNSPLHAVYDNGKFYNIRVAGSVFDSEGDLWVASSLARYGLCVLRSNGTWEKFDTQELMGVQHDINSIAIDPFYEYKWVIPRDEVNKIYLFDNRGKGIYINPNKGSNVQSNYVNAVAFDLDEVVWIGTNKGIKLIYTIDDIFTTSSGSNESEKECHNIIYTENGNSQYLLEFENISSIVVDGANRKWIGTSGGVFLISADGSQQLLHFTEENSPLPSNKILCIEINSTTGEVFFGTDKGTVSFKSTATGFGEKNENVYVYPNPVRPDYTGPIAIKGLVQDAVVKITDVAGNLVYNTKALGGQAIWYGRNMSGKKVASGVYLVFIADEDNDEKAVSKVLFLK